MGLQQIVVRELTKYPDRTNRILGSAFLMKLSGAAVSMILIFFAIGLLKPEDDGVRLVVLLVSLTYIFQAFDVMSFFFQSRVLSKYTAIARGIAVIGSSILKVYLILAKFSVVYFALAYVLDIFVISILLLYLFYKTGNDVRDWKFDVDMAKGLFGYSWPFMIAIFLVTIHLKIDQMMIENLLGMESLGLYSVSVRLSEAWYFVPAMMSSTLLPYIIRLRETNYSLYTYRLKQAYFGMFWLGVFVALGVQIFGEWVLVLLYGKEYGASFDALALNIWAGVFVAQSSFKSIWVVSENVQIYRVYINAIGIIVNVVGNLVLIPIYGISGAAMATLITRMVNNWVTPLVFGATRENALNAMISVNPFYILKQGKLLR